MCGFFLLRGGIADMIRALEKSPSSRGLGHHPFTVSTGVRIPLGTPGLFQQVSNTDSFLSPSSRGLGHHPFTVSTGVRIPLGTPVNAKSRLVRLFALLRAKSCVLTTESGCRADCRRCGTMCRDRPPAPPVLHPLPWDRKNYSHHPDRRGRRPDSPPWQQPDSPPAR